jgi:cytochrome c peroxidase
MKNNRTYSRWLQGLLLASFSSLLLILGCQKDVAIPDSSAGISFNVPKDWPAPTYRFEGNPLSTAGFTLGRKLFYDTRLSKDNTVSCGTCHQGYAAFANFDHPVSHGIDNLLGTRNSPPLFNLNWHTSFMWDGGINHIEVQPLAPIQNPVEMGENINNVMEKLQADKDYPGMFQTVFGSSEITSDKIFKAIAQFMGAMVSANSKYDHYMRHESGGDMNSSELAGLEVFRQYCASCHKEPLFTDFSFRNKGLKHSGINDSGRAHITLDAGDLYKFKVPSLRNLKYSPPYGHDGRYSSLEQVLDQMESGVIESPTLDPLMKGGIKLTAQQRTDLLNFLNTLNDEQFVQDKRFQEPAP